MDRDGTIIEEKQYLSDPAEATDPMLTQASNVQRFKREWSDWLGFEYSVFVNSGFSTNLLALCAPKEALAPREVVVLQRDDLQNLE